MKIKTPIKSYFNFHFFLLQYILALIKMKIEKGLFYSEGEWLINLSYLENCVDLNESLLKVLHRWFLELYIAS